MFLKIAWASTRVVQRPNVPGRCEKPNATELRRLPRWLEKPLRSRERPGAEGLPGIGPPVRLQECSLCMSRPSIPIATPTPAVESRMVHHYRKVAIRRTPWEQGEYAKNALAEATMD